MTIGQIIKKERLLAGLTQKELAEKCGILNKLTISQYETGFRLPSIENLKKMSDIFKKELKITFEEKATEI